MMRTSTWVLATAVGLAAACVQNERSDIAFFPDKDQFVNGGVSAFMEARCGALDCHGQIGRPLRIYSKNGLRLVASDQGLRDTRDTTPEERTENYQAVIGLEPEALSDCVRTQGEYVDFQLLLKPLGEDNRGIRHKGGPVLRAASNDPGWNCLHGWASGPQGFDAAQCKAATF